MEWKALRARVGLIGDIVACQILREGCSYLQSEEKLLTLHLGYLDNGSMNHFVRYIKRFLDSMEVVMDKRIRDYIHAVDPLTNRKRGFAFAADKIIELHKAGDAIGMLILKKEVELKHIFLDYLLVTK